ncbi:MAG: hypothetical protein IJI05_05030 [Erysipelotrichaceae bacterium]|nr:hypothetical protein [Erysipelotrichaceae bacterium]
MTEIKKFMDKDGYIYALAAMPDNYLTGASLVDKLQHETVPFFVTAHAIDTTRNIMIFGLTDEMFTTYKNEFIKLTLKAVPNVIWDSIRDFVEPEQYLQQFAEAISAMKLTPVAQTNLPSIFGQNIDSSYKSMMMQYQAAFDRETQLGTPTQANNSICDAILVKYYGEKNGARYVVLAGMDYKGIEYYTNTSALSVLSPIGGLIGGLLKQKQAEKSSNKFGHGKPCDAIDWGAANRFALITPVEYEEEATRDFINFVSTFHMEDSLRTQFYNKVAERAMMMMQQSMQLQQMAQQSMINLQRSQQQLARTLAENSAAMSAGIMDSWNQKMASDSRISQARSEATLGVNTYQNTYGQNVSVDVAADHVYQNQYGDVYGVSGNALDNDVLTKLNWKELNK